jgi:hypothetical protein
MCGVGRWGGKGEGGGEEEREEKEKIDRGGGNFGNTM